MTHFKKVVTGVLALAMTFSLTACKDTTWTYQANDVTITSGMYLGMLVNSWQEALSKVTDSSADLWGQKIEEKDAAQWIKDSARQKAIDYVAVENQFKELKLSLTEEEKAEYTAAVDQQWTNYGSYFEENGCGKTSYTKLMENQYKSSKLFDKYYKEGGIKAVSDADLKKHFKENYAKVKMIALPTTDSSTGSALSDDEKKKVKTKAEGYLKRLKNGESIDKINTEYQKEVSAASASSSSASTSSASSASGSDETKAVEASIIKKGSGYPEKFETALFKAGNKAPFLVEEDSFYIVAIRYDILEDSKDFDTNKDSVLADLKGDEFEALVDEWGKAVKLTANEAAVKRYDPKKLVDPNAQNAANAL